MTKQEAKEQRRKAKQLARLLGHREFGFANSLFVPGDGIMAVRISVYWNGKEYQANGGSKCNRIDPWNEEIGLEIAAGRALLRIAYQILKEEEIISNLSQIAIDGLEGSPIEKEVLEAIEKEYGNVTGVVFVKKGPGPRVMFEAHDTAPKPSQVLGSRTYRGSDQMQYGWGVIQPEVVPTGLEVMKEKGMLDDDRGDKTEGQPE